MNEVLYPVNEIFITIQGEATFTGTPSCFIRLQGCNVGCPWCDTKHTWQLDANTQISVTELVNKANDKDSWASFTLNEIKDFVKTHASTIKHVVITGGEPALYDLKPLCDMLEALGKTVQIETSGTELLRISEQAWVTLSPKFNMPGGKQVLIDAVKRANEIKMPIGKVSDIEKLKTFIFDYDFSQRIPIWLQPLSQNKEATKICVKEALNNNWRLSLQTHKFIAIR